jgi:hypothetical protein
MEHKIFPAKGGVLIIPGSCEAALSPAAKLAGKMEEGLFTQGQSLGPRSSIAKTFNNPLILQAQTGLKGAVSSSKCNG